ncbi:MAG TPA: HlyD family efflux transporter periplasmic adaptor subunit [Candidatus Binatia bacterium]|nr:HlyD family efflux transporter periplasmic adaptor subunit [Candidatus Binatia bacterium]
MGNPTSPPSVENTPLSPNAARATPPSVESTPSSPKAAPVTTPSKSNEWRKVAAQLISIIVVLGSAVLTLWVWNISERHPRTDDATARANVVGIAPRVRGQIIKLNVQDNQAVAAGDVLFEIDPADYELALERAKAALATLDQQIEVARSQDAQLKFQVKAADAGVERAKAELKQAGDTLQRLEPLLTNGFAKADDVDRAATAKHVAAAALAAEEQRLNQAQIALSGLATLTAQRAGAVAAVDLAALELSYCKVVAPFPGRVVSLNISIGAYANAGIAVFSLLDTRKWYVMANFREAEIRHMAPGSEAIVYLSSAPDRKFPGKVQGIGWAVAPEGEIDLPAGGVPYVKRELNWVRVAQRFPVRIEVENPDLDLFHMGASAVAIMKGPPRK